MPLMCPFFHGHCREVAHTLYILWWCTYKIPGHTGSIAGQLCIMWAQTAADTKVHLTAHSLKSSDIQMVHSAEHMVTKMIRCTQWLDWTGVWAVPHLCPQLLELMLQTTIWDHHVTRFFSIHFSKLCQWDFRAVPLDSTRWHFFSILMSMIFLYMDACLDFTYSKDRKSPVILIIRISLRTVISLGSCSRSGRLWWRVIYEGDEFNINNVFPMSETAC
jgi:hypothetical protein